MHKFEKFISFDKFEQIKEKTYTKNISKKQFSALLNISDTVALNIQKKTDNTTGEILLISDLKRTSERVLKTSKKDAMILAHEFNVGLRLSDFNIKHITQVYFFITGRFEFNVNIKSLIVMEHAQGNTISSFINKLTINDIRIYHRHLMMIIAYIQSRIPYTHYDLHSGNVLVEYSPNIEKEYSYSCFGKDYSIVSKFGIKLIDYETNYIEGLSDERVNLDAMKIYCGMVPNVFDPFYDLAFVGNLYFWTLNIYDIQFANMLNMNSFVPYSPYSKIEDYKINGFFIGREKNPDWRDILLYEFDFITNTYYTSRESCPKTVKEFLSDVILSPPKSPNELFKLKKLYGSVIKYNKEKNIRNRKYSGQMIFEYFMLITLALI